MSVRTFPALGFDPAPGSPAALLAQAREADQAARALAGAAAAAGRLSAEWDGDAAAAYRAQAPDLPRDLGLAAAAHGTLARELTAFAEDLGGRQVRAADLESRAAALRATAGSATGGFQVAPGGPGGHTPGGSGSSGSSAGGMRPAGTIVAARAGTGVADPEAAARARVALSELEAVLAEARRLLGEHRSAAARAATRIRAAAADPPYRKPGLLSRAGHSVRGWIADHAETLTRISRGLRGISTALGLLSLVPGFQFLAPIAFAAGAAAVALDTVVAASTGRGNWPGLALDAVLTALPTAPATRAVRSLPGAERLLKAANRAIPATVRGRIFRTVRNLPEGITPDQLAAAAARIRSGAPGLTGDVVVQGSRAGHSAHAASDIDIGLRVDPGHYDRLIAEFFGPDPSREAAVNAVARGRIFWRHAGLKQLRTGLESDLGRKVDLSIIKRGGLFDNEPWLRVP